MSEYPNPITTVDVVLLTIMDDRLCVALVRRETEPEMGRPALIGGYVHVDEDSDLQDTASRILREKAGLDGIFLEQLMTFSGAARDPRGWSISVAYFALVPRHMLNTKGSIGTTLVPVDEVDGLAFDHDAILRTAVERVRGKGGYSTIPARLLPDAFTMSELRTTYEIVMGERLDPSAFRRKILALDVIESVPGETRPGRRPAEVFRLKGGVDVFDRRL